MPIHIDGGLYDYQDRIRRARRFADERGCDLDYAHWRCGVDDVSLKLAWILAISLRITREELFKIANILWDLSEEDCAQALDKEILEGNVWTRVHHGNKEHGWKKYCGRAFIAREFRDVDSANYKKVHRLLSIGDVPNFKPDPFGRWKYCVEAAFYWAGVYPDRGLRILLELLLDVPNDYSVPKKTRFAKTMKERLWLSGLIMRQEYLLEEQPALLACFRGAYNALNI